MTGVGVPLRFTQILQNLLLCFNTLPLLMRCINAFLQCLSSGWKTWIYVQQVFISFISVFSDVIILFSWHATHHIVKKDRTFEW